MEDEEVIQYIQDIPNEVLARMKFSVPWQYGATEELSETKDSDGFPVVPVGTKTDDPRTREVLQKQCWTKFNRNPQINTAVRGVVGRLTGWGYETTSGLQKIQEAIDEIELDWRNRLYSFWPQYVGRAYIEGELFLCLTCHLDGFIEVDFIDPGMINRGGKDGTGIIYHPTKTTLPLFYNISNYTNTGLIAQIPSIYIARDPSLVQLPATGQGYELSSDHMSYDRKLQQTCRSRKRKFAPLGGYYKFIVSWDRGFVTRRTISYLRTVLEWLNHYENLKKYEIDHKKSAGSYLWVFTFENPRDFKLWLSLSDDERRKTGILQKKTPGGSLVLPPGISVECKNPDLTPIKDQDTDILQMVTSGLNEAADVTTGTSKGTFASVRATRGPMSDRTSDEVAYFDRFQKYDFWGSIFFLKSKLVDFPSHFNVKEAVDFDDNRKPVFKKVKKRPEQLVDIGYPISEITNFEGRAKGLLGVKHGPVSESLGIPTSEVAKRLGLGGHHRMRLRKATEDELFPELVYTVDAEKVQEETETGRPPKKKTAGKQTEEK